LLTKDLADAIAAGKKPDGLTADCALAYDVAKYLCGTPGPLPESLWDASVKAFGKDTTLALVTYVGFYAFVCIAVNACDVPAPVEAGA
jgi:4-carboxymuconolactone decarboxylase